jgi:hypothetical protein
MIELVTTNQKSEEKCMLDRRFVQSLLKYVSSAVLVGLMSSVLVAAQSQTGIKGKSLTHVFTYSSFSDITGLTLNGNAAQEGGALLIGQPTTYNIGSVYYTNQVNVAAGFQTLFTLQILPPSGIPSADGMAFIVQNSSVNALGNNDGQPGYEGIADSMAVEFDTFQNQHLSDPNSNHVGVQSCGTLPNSIDHASSCDLGIQPNLPVTLADGNPHQVMIRYMPGLAGATGKLTVEIDKQHVITVGMNLSTLLSLNGNDAWVGLTAGSGAYWESGVVKSWSFSSGGTAE